MPDVCEERDPKGYYKKARQGLIFEFTGVSAPYEQPEHPEVILNTHEETVVESVARVMYYLEENGIIE